MLNLLQILRYSVFVGFIICNAVITSVAVWNLSIVQTLSGPAFTTATQIDSFLIFLGAAGLVLIFPILFLELYGKNLFVGRVWFELLWVGLFWLMQLAGAAALTAQGTAQFCSDNSQDSSSPCASTQVLQAFTWIVAILMLGYFTLLSILTIVKYSDDPTILKCSVRRFPVMQSQNSLKSEPASPKFRLSFRAHPATEQQHASPPDIVAPQPRRHFAALRAAILSHRHSGGDEEASHQRQTSLSSVVSPPLDEDERNRPSSYYPDVMVQQSMTSVLQEAASAPPPAVPAPITFTIEHLRPVRRPTLPPTSSTPFYNSAVRTAIDGDKPSTIPAAPRPLPSVQAQVGKVAEPPSPPPLGDWPRLDATSRPRTKRKPTPTEHAERQMQPLTRLNMLLDRSQPEASGSTPQSQSQSQPQLQPRASSSRVYEPQPVASSSRPPDSGFAAQSWQQTYNHRQEPAPPRPVEMARQNSVLRSYDAEQARQRNAHERPQRRPSAVLPRPPTLQARRTSESRSQAALYLGTPADNSHPEAQAPTIVAAAAPAPAQQSHPTPAPASGPTRKESQRRPLPIPEPQSPPASSSLARADSSVRPARHLPPAPAEGAQVSSSHAPTSVPPPSWRHKPGGPRRQSNDGDPSSPPPGLDRFHSIRSSDFSGQY